jgi:Trp operon repressor
MTDVLDLLDRAHAAHRQEAVDANVELLTDLLARQREVREIRIKAGVGAVLVTVDDATIRLAMP